MSTQEVGYVGLGQMGLWMAEALIEGGQRVVGFDLRPEAGVELEQLGGVAGASVADIATRAQVVGVCVISEPGVAAVCEELWSGMQPGGIILVHSTVQPPLIVDLAARAAEHDILLVDAMVSGDGPAAKAGRLSLMVGAQESELEPAAAYLAAVGTTIHYLGSRGGGCATKLANNVMSIINQFAFFEAQRLAASYGVSSEKLVEVVSTSSGGSVALTNHKKAEWNLEHHTLSGTPAIYTMFSKDLDMARYAAQANGIDLAFVAAASELTADQLGRRMQELGIPVPPKD